MIRIHFSDTELQDINEALDCPDTPAKIQRKLMLLRIHSTGAKHGLAAEILNLSPNTVTAYLKEYRDGGLAAIMEDRAYRPSSSLEPFLPCLRCVFNLRPPATAREAMAVIERISGVSLSQEQTRRILNQLGMKYRRTGQIPGKADPQLQFEFFTNKLQPRLQEAAEARRKVFYVDAAHFVLGCFLGMVWCFKRLFTRGSSGRQRYNVLGAVCSHTRELFTVRTEENINRDRVMELLELIRRAHPKIPITLVMDNAKYQRAREVQACAAKLKIELLYLPPYSPNLNLIERLWKLLKSRCLRNRYFPAFADFKKSINLFLDSLSTDYQDDLQRIISNRFQFFSNS